MEKEFGKQRVTYHWWKSEYKEIKQARHISNS